MCKYAKSSPEPLLGLCTWTPLVPRTSCLISVYSSRLG